MPAEKRAAAFPWERNPITTGTTRPRRMLAGGVWAGLPDGDPPGAALNRIRAKPRRAPSSRFVRQRQRTPTVMGSSKVTYSGVSHFDSSMPVSKRSCPRGRR